MHVEAETVACRRGPIFMTDTIPSAPAAAGARPAERVGLLRSPAAKFFLIAFLCGALMVPLLMVWALTAEREGRRAEVLRTLAAEWANPQSVYGPLLLVPYTVERRHAAREGEAPTVTLERQTAVVLPDDLKVTADAPTETRRISIYEASVYTASVTLSGRFGGAARLSLGPGLREVHWADARIAVGLTDLGGVEKADFAAGSTSLSVEPGMSVSNDQGQPGLHAGLPATLTAGGETSQAASGLPFTVTLRFKGTETLTVAPVGRESEITLASDWPHPSFSAGTSLPSERTVSAAGFTATWRVPFFARAIPQSWTVETDGLTRFGGEVVGAGFQVPVDTYALTERALKYGLMFIGAVFGIVFVLEILSPRRIHVVQYAIVGLILVFFYVLLLAFAEQIGFGASYALASVATGAVVAAFVGLQLESRARAATAAAGFAALFSMLYVILRLEDVALMAGAILGFGLLTTVLFATRRVDWSGGRTAGPAA
jgi:inner membrane protein